MTALEHTLISQKLIGDSKENTELQQSPVSGYSETHGGGEQSVRVSTAGIGFIDVARQAFGPLFPCSCQRPTRAQVRSPARTKPGHRSVPSIAAQPRVRPQHPRGSYPSTKPGHGSDPGTKSGHGSDPSTAE